VLSKRAFKFLESLDSKPRTRVIADLDVLSDFPSWDRSLDIVKLEGQKDYFRLRRGKIRVVFMVDEESRAILVRKIAYREAAYE
jgi:mRNA-degrading endonuclease RelE of RelBE toxin-antitoxin system